MIDTTVIPIVMSADENYANYMAVTIVSIMENSSNQFIYHFFILDCNITEESKGKLVRQINKYKNAKLNFLDITKYLITYQNILPVRLHFTIACYMRLFVCNILKKFDKILYIDVDTVIQNDIKILYDHFLGHHILAACADITIETEIESNQAMADYCYKKLGLSPEHIYFNSGVLLINAKKWRDEDYTRQCIEKLLELEKTLYPDQCILNAVCKKDILFFSPKWNYQWHFNNINKTVIVKNNIKLAKLLEEYYLAGNNPYLIHYTSEIKPWDNLQKPLTEYWWQYAKKTFFYEELFSSYILNNHKNCHLKTNKTEKKIYFLGVRIIKIKENNDIKKYYIFNIPIFYIKKKL